MPPRDAVGLVADVLNDLALIAVNDEILLEAARLDPPTLRSLDAIHLAAAKTLGGSLGQIVTYDRRMAEAAQVLGLSTIAPGR